MLSHENPDIPVTAPPSVVSAVEHALESGLTLEEAEQTIELCDFRKQLLPRIKEQDQIRQNNKNALSGQRTEQFVNTTRMFHVTIAIYLLGVALFVILVFLSGKDAPLVQFAFPVTFIGMVCSAYSIVQSLIQYKRLDKISKRNLFWNVILLLPFLLYYSIGIYMINRR